MKLEFAPSQSAMGLRPGWRRGCGQALRAIWHRVAFYGLLALFALSCLAWTIVAAPLLAVLPRRAGRTAGQFLIMVGFRGFIALMRAAGVMSCDLGALDALRDRGPLILAPNHPTLLDVVLVVSRLPRVVCTAKAKLLDHPLFWPLFGVSARLAGYVRNDTPVHLVREGIRQLGEGRQLLIFPEGTRSPADGLHPFKGGFALIAEQAGVPVQTIFIDSNSDFLGKGWPLLRMPRFPLTYRVRLGPVVRVSGDRADFVSALQRSYCHALAAHRS